MRTGMTQDEATALMTGRGHQEVGEAAGKWRRALLTSAQLSTYYVGYSEVVELPADWPNNRSGRSCAGTTRCSRTGRRPRGTCARCWGSERRR